MTKNKNTVKASNGIEVYTHNIFCYADEYIEQELGGTKDKIKEFFPDLLVYISERIPKPPNEDIELLDSIFDIYVRLCTRNGVLPTLEAFSWLVKIERHTFTDWSKGGHRAYKYYTMDGEPIVDLAAWKLNHRGVEYRQEPSTAHSATVKKWFDICKAHTVNRLINKGGTDANLIFAAKAAYGMVETSSATIQPQQEKRVLTASELPRLGGESSDN